jgi:hypothetical protein
MSKVEKFFIVTRPVVVNAVLTGDRIQIYLSFLSPFPHSLR